MPVTTTVKNYNGFMKGLVTEGNPFNAPNDSVRDMVNCEVGVEGGIRRRKGLAKESVISPESSVFGTDTNNFVVNVFEWPAPGGSSVKNFVVSFQGNSLTVWDKVDGKISDNLKFTASIPTMPNDSAYYGTAVRGTFVIRDRILIYNELTDTISFSGNVFPQIRDFAGIDDGFAIDDKPLTQNFNIFSNTVEPPVGTTITGVSSGATAVFAGFIKVFGGDPLHCFFIESTGLFINGEILTGWGTGGQVTSVPVGTIHSLHDYNLQNQGWSQQRIINYIGGPAIGTIPVPSGVPIVFGGRYPSNAQIPSAGKDSNGDFSAEELDKVDFGTSLAPRGHFIISTNAINTRQLVSGLAVPNGNSAEFQNDGTVFSNRYCLCGSDPNRIGQPSNNLLISQQITDIDSVIVNNGSLGRFYQLNDPTAEIGNELLDTDGIVIPILEAEEILGSHAFGSGLFVFATNGVWVVRGGLETGFSASNFSLDKISNKGCVSIASVVETQTALMYWSHSGIFAVSQDSIGNYSTSNVSEQTIRTFYNSFSAGDKISAKGFYDQLNERVFWSYADTVGYGSDHNTRILVLNLKEVAFFPYTFSRSSTNLDVFGGFISGFTQNPNELGFEDEVKPLLYHYRDANTLHRASWGEFRRVDFRDVIIGGQGATNYLSNFTTWDDHLGGPILDKRSQYVFCYLNKTEDGFTDIGGGVLTPDNTSSCMMTGKWDWSVTDEGGKFSTQREVYRHRRVYIPVDANDTFDNGVSVVWTKNKVRGKGKALALRFDSQEGIDFQMIGISVPYEVETTA